MPRHAAAMPPLRDAAAADTLHGDETFSAAAALMAFAAASDASRIDAAITLHRHAADIIFADAAAFSCLRHYLASALQAELS